MVRRQQGLQLCVIIRMCADVVGGIMCFELFFEGILETLGLVLVTLQRSLMALAFVKAWNNFH